MVVCFIKNMWAISAVLADLSTIKLRVIPGKIPHAVEIKQSWFPGDICGEKYCERLINYFNMILLVPDIYWSVLSDYS